MKILIITPYYHPYINPRAHRWTSIATHWAKEDHDIHVICSKNPNFPKFEILQSVNVYRTGYNSIKEILYHIFRNKNKRGIVGKGKEGKGRGGVIMQWINDKILKKIYFPDDAFMWYFPARKLAKKLTKQHDFDCVISSSIPFTSHLVGLYIKNNNPELKWIADTGDPFAFQPLHPMNNYYLYGSWNKKLEGRVVEKATYITLTNEGAMKMYSNLFPKNRDKFVLIPPLFQAEGKKTISSSFYSENEIHIGYFGSFFKKIREPKVLLEFISCFFKKHSKYRKKLKLHFFGNIFENFLKDFQDYEDLVENIIFHGLIDRGEVYEKMQKMDFLINIGNGSSFQLASKCTDYLFSGKPIINLKTIEEDTFEVFFKDYSYFLSINVKDENEDELNEFIKRYKGKLLGENYRMELITEYLVDKIASSYMSLLIDFKKN